MTFGQPENMLIFDSTWLDRPAELGNRVVFPTIVALCDALLEELDCREEGVAGKGAAGGFSQKIARTSPVPRRSPATWGSVRARFVAGCETRIRPFASWSTS